MLKLNKKCVSRKQKKTKKKIAGIWNWKFNTFDTVSNLAIKETIWTPEIKFWQTNWEKANLALETAPKAIIEEFKDDFQNHSKYCIDIFSSHRQRNKDKKAPSPDCFFTPLTILSF